MNRRQHLIEAGQVTANTFSLDICVLGGPNLWRLGLQTLLTGRPNLAQVTHAPDPAQVAESPDVFLLDGRIADDLLSPALTSFPQTRLLVIADELNEATVLAWLERGVLGCIHRDPSRRILVAVQCQRTHWLELHLKKMPDIELVDYREL